MTTLIDTRYQAVVTTDPAIVTGCLALRRQVFSAEFGAGDDRDEFDEVCEHLAVLHDGEVVGTYRILLPGASESLYPQGEFALDALAPLRPELVEIGRSCVHPAHRTGAVINLMWATLGRYAQSAGYRHLAGCASVSLADGGVTAADTWELTRARHLSPAGLRVEPHRPWVPLPRTQERPSYAAVPPLLRGYLRLGAWVCGPPAHDPEFAVADFFTLLSFDRVGPRYRRYLFGDGR
ncbi:GNAT family N-acetyltransferase [Amycolatopsis alkalitolerans]|uniref:GNAT family N-acetyltransferase n=1 Tax=Amycolatopsis alkalitolerans TaxID=2547244 RepID=A0A5C4M7P2_9PSEU|nr:GNAT family N-acyltransferase [Amycolatopsis alkalitolerans]TNC28536.1 GNAT family N-acetyltransferase [Amycolatopsis alkalitolerans]